MMPFTRFDRHVRLMNRMADALGVDLETQMLSGTLSPESYREKVLRCTGCENADACERFLDVSDGFAEAAPAYCRNKAALEGAAGL